MTMVHKSHKRWRLGRVLRHRAYPWATATSPLRRYLRGNGDGVSWLTALKRTGESMGHCYPRQNDVFWVTVQRSGHNWLAMVYALVVAHYFEGRRLTLAEVAGYRPHVYRHVSVRYDLGDHLTGFHFHLPIPRLMHTHSGFRPELGQRKVLLQLRHPHDVLISKFYHGEFFREMGLVEFLGTGTARGLMDFFNSWGEVVVPGRVPNHHLVYYEDLKQKPLETVQAVLRFFELDDVSVEMIRYALEQTALGRVRERELKERGLDDERALRKGRSGAIGQAETLTGVERDALTGFCREHLVWGGRYVW